MKRKFFLIFLLLNLSFVLAGCGNTPYSIEREYWYLQRKANKIFVNPDASPTRQVNRVINSLSSFAKKHPNTSLEVSAEFSIASIYIIKKEYSFARKQLNYILNKHKELPGVCSEALFLIGNTYELDDKWGQALVKYKEVVSIYPNTRRGLDVPFYIAQYYKSKYQPDKMMEAYREAAVHYEGLSMANKDSPLGYSTALLAVQAKIEVKDIPGGIATLNLIISNYKNPEMQANALMNIALLYVKTKDNLKAKEILKRVVNDYPKSRLVKDAQRFLKELDKK